MSDPGLAGGFQAAGWKSSPVLVGSSELACVAVNEGAEAWPVALVPDPPGDSSPSTYT